MRKLQANYANIMSTIAVLIALTIGGAQAAGLITSKDIRNGAVKSVDLRNGGVRSPDIKNDAVGSPDLAPESVEGEALDLPGPVKCVVTGSASLATPTLEFQKVADLCTMQKGEAGSVLEVTWDGSVRGENGGEASGCIFQLRVNDSPSAQGGGETFGRGLSPASASSIFTGIAPGTVVVSVWARITISTSMGNLCAVGPDTAGVSQTVTVVEQVV